MAPPDSSTRSPRCARRCGASTWSGASGGCRGSAKFDHGTNAFALCERSEAIVDFVQPDAARDQLVESDATGQVLVRDPRKVARGPRIAVARAHDALFAHQRAPAKGHLLVDVDLAEPHHFSA